VLATSNDSPVLLQLRAPCRTAANRRRGPGPDSCSATNALFDYLVGTGEERLGDREADCLGGPEIDDQLDFRRLLDREVGGFLSLENSADI
jgi:hypothetical protein